MSQGKRISGGMGQRILRRDGFVFIFHSSLIQVKIGLHLHSHSPSFYFQFAHCPLRLLVACVLERLSLALWLLFSALFRPRVGFPVAQLVKSLPAMQETPVWFLGREESPGEGIGYPFQFSWVSLVAQMVKNPLVIWETWVRSLGCKDPMEEGMANLLQYSGLESMGLQRVRRDWVTFTFPYLHGPWKHRCWVTRNLYMALVQIWVSYLLTPVFS